MKLIRVGVDLAKNGRSAGLAPLKILSTYTAACRYVSPTFTP